MTDTTETANADFLDKAAIAAVVDELQVYEDEASKAQERLLEIKEAIRTENANALIGVSAKVRDRLAQLSGWGADVLR